MPIWFTALLLGLALILATGIIAVAGRYELVGQTGSAAIVWEIDRWSGQVRWCVIGEGCSAWH